MTSEESTTSKTIEEIMEYQSKMVYGTDIVLGFDPNQLFSIPEGVIYWQNVEVLDKDRGRSGRYKAFVKILDKGKLVELGIAYVHNITDVLACVAFTAPEVLSRSSIDVICPYGNHGIFEIPERAHFKMDEPNTQTLKKYLKSASE